MLMVAFSVESRVALAHDTNEESIAAIWGHQAAAAGELDAVVASAADEMAATNDPAQVTAIVDSTMSDLGHPYEDGLAAMWSEVVNAHFFPAVVAAFNDAKNALDAHYLASEQAVHDAADARVEEILVDDILTKINNRLTNGLNKIDGYVADVATGLDGTSDPVVAAGIRDGGLTDVANQVATTTRKLDNQLDRAPDNPEVQAAHAAAIVTLEAAADDAVAEINALYDDWLGGTTSTTTPPPTTTTLPVTTTTVVLPTTTTTLTLPSTTTSTLISPPTTTTTSTTTTLLSTTSTVSPTTTTVSPTTTTSVPGSTTTTTSTPAPSTTTTTVAASAPTPPPRPPRSNTAFMPDLPSTVVVAGAATKSQASGGERDGMATVGLVQRVIDTQLPSGVSAVAAGPLVVLGLIIDAIRAAGALMLIPWLVLGIYVVGLLSGRRLQPESLA